MTIFSEGIIYVDRGLAIKTQHNLFFASRGLRNVHYTQIQCFFWVHSQWKFISKCLYFFLQVNKSNKQNGIKILNLLQNLHIIAKLIRRFSIVRMLISFFSTSQDRILSLNFRFEFVDTIASNSTQCYREIYEILQMFWETVAKLFSDYFSIIEKVTIQ